MRFILITDDADQPTIDKAIRLLAARKNAACIPSTKDEIQADIDELLERRTALTG